MLVNKLSELQFIFILIMLLFPAGRLSAVDLKDEGGCFNWAFLKIDNNDNYVSLTHEAEIIRKKRQDQLIIYLLPKENAYIYLLLFKPESRFTLFFPDSFKLFQKEKAYHFTKYYIPAAGRGQGLFDNPGEYKLYFIASTIRLPELEQLIKECLKTPQENDQIPDAVCELEAEIQRINALFLIADDHALPPHPVGGTFRSEDEFIDRCSVEIENKPYYVQCFKIISQE